MPSPAASPSRRDGWRLLGETVRLHRGWTTVGVLAGLVWTAAKVTVPSLTRRAIDHGIVGDEDGALVKWTLLIVAVGTVSAICVGLRRYSAFGVAYKTETDCGTGCSPTCNAFTSRSTITPRPASSCPAPRPTSSRSRASSS